MNAPGSVLAGRLFAAIRADTVAAAIGVDPTTWASTTVPRVFHGLGGFYGGRCRGRLPFIEFGISGGGQAFAFRNVDGGDLQTDLIIRAHLGGGDEEVVSNASELMLLAILTSVRATVGTDNYLAMGTQRVAPLEAGPWGHQRDGVLTFSHSWSRDTFETSA